MLSGLLCGGGMLLAVFLGLQVVSRKLALRSIFFLTSAFMFLTATRLLGEAVGDFQTAHLIPATEIAGAGWLARFGLNATWEAVALQAMALAAAVTAFVAFIREKRRKQVESVGTRQ